MSVRRTRIMHRLSVKPMRLSSCIGVEMPPQKICEKRMSISDHFSMKCLEENMKNLNEPPKSREDVVRFERRGATEKERIEENETTGSLLPGHQMEDLRGRWTTIQ